MTTTTPPPHTLTNGYDISLSNPSKSVPNTTSKDAATAATAVLKPSISMPSTSTRIRGVDFNEFPQSITVEALTSSFARTGFQASNLAKAIEIVNNMVHPQRNTRLI